MSGIEYNKIKKGNVYWESSQSGNLIVKVISDINVEYISMDEKEITFYAIVCDKNDEIRKVRYLINTKYSHYSKLSTNYEYGVIISGKYLPWEGFKEENYPDFFY